LNKEYFIIQQENNVYTKEIKHYQKLIDKEYKRKNITNIEIASLYENIAKDMNITIISFTFEQNIIALQINGELNNTLSFIGMIEQINRIKTLSVSYKDKKIITHIVLDTKYSNNNSVQKEFIKLKNPFIENRVIQKEKEKSLGVFGEYILYKGEWITIGAYYKGKKIIKIEKNSIILEDENGTQIKEQIDG
jgi:hypothetical protein